MSDIIREPTDAEFSALMDGVSPDRLREPVDNEPAPEVPVVEEPAATAPAADELPEKYRGKSAAEIAEMHAQLESRLGQQSQELGELRALRGEFDEFRQSLSTQQAPEPAPWETPSFDNGLDEQVLTRPQETLDWISKNQPQLYNRAIETWASIDPFAASRYDTQQTLARERQELQQQLQAVQAPIVQSQNDAALQQAYLNVVNSNPLLTQVADDIPALIEENPDLQWTLSTGDVTARERALNNLVAIAAHRRGASGVTQPTPAELAAQSAQAKIAAGVVTSGSSAERAGQTGTTPGQRMLASEGTSVAEELARNRAAALAAGQRRA